jgi:hypothetical protein
MIRAHFAYPSFAKNEKKLNSIFGLKDVDDEEEDEFTPKKTK